jgi:hypothetical protein
MDNLELLVSEAYGDGAVEAVIRPAAVVPEESARQILVELAAQDVRMGGNWCAEPTTWRRYDKAWDGPDRGPGTAELIGSLQIAYGMPTRFEITIFRASVTRSGTLQGVTVETLCDEALGLGGLSLASCPRADLRPPPQPFRFNN